MSAMGDYLRQIAAPHYLMELLIAHQVTKGVSLARLSLTECQPAAVRSLCVDGVPVVTEILPVHLLVDQPLGSGPCMAGGGD